MEEAYKGYAYKRYKQPVLKLGNFKKRLFWIVSVPIILAIVLFSANLIFGFISFGGGAGKSINIGSVTFYVSYSDPINNKPDAMAKVVQIRNQGGSGYLVADGAGWLVVDQLSNREFQGSVAVTTLAASLSVTNNDHIELLQTLVGTFASTFDTLVKFTDAFKAGEMTRQEISDSARIAYNNLLDLVEKLPRVDYEILWSSLVFQLFGLHIIWLDGTDNNFPHVLSNAKSWVIFAFKDLTEILKM